MKTFTIRLLSGWAGALIGAVLLSSNAFAQVKKLTVRINTAKTYQIIENFGASDAWAGQFIGQWPENKKNEIADLLFSNATRKDGSPVGIGLSMWRFNIGAGTTEQGTASGIKDDWKRTESFLTADGSYDWTKQSGQIWFLNAAKKRGVKQFLGFSNSPPVNYTLNGKGYSSDGKANIAKERYDDFAGYLSTTVKGISQLTNINLDYISPVNEPQWDWKDGKQEGSPFTNEEIYGVVKAIDQSFIQNNIKSKIIIGEAGKIDYLYSRADKGSRGMQIAEFFKPQSPRYIGNLKTVAQTITAHSYFTTSPKQTLIKGRTTLADSVAKIPGLSFWQSEYCILGDNDGEIKGNGRDLGMDAALYVAKVIHTDITVANATAWQWWLAISPYDYKDGLIYIDKNKTDGNYYASKMLWVLGNYSRFIKPGYVRFDVKPTTELPEKVMLSAYKHNKQLTVVIINADSEDYELEIEKMKVDAAYETSEQNELKISKPVKKVKVKARSVLTLTGSAR
ncbi:glycoside hydrolase [Mucilaginibacter auburnensis]|uniref:O-glycosyl hydrolase n=1 Tax=Mucilaginibacter auburnensis TaxID=1457233 RepID=A0A2H9VU67_9SPHI|nr:glycoside hydrolase [Mucilaginibacter auburnensis]PJJ84351.1 O-glycosyl hydrolase [Mucilaginibacter auburnensis]